MSELSRSDLRRAVEGVLAGTDLAELRGSVARLMAAYRSGEPPATPVLSTLAQVEAYTAYRMPATVAAIVAALDQLAATVPGWAPASLLDLGAGTGAAAWAVADRLPSVARMTLLEQAPAAIGLGRRLARSAPDVVQSAEWRPWRLAAAGDLPGADVTPDERPAGELPAADLVTAGYVLGELDAGQRRRLVRAAAGSAGTVVLVEPGTPAGYRRILDARDELIALGLTILAPCPHQRACPLGAGDWCHFGVRVDRSSLHRRLKDAERSFEDEKFSYVAAARGAAGGTPAARVIRRPRRRRGLVSLRLCTEPGQVQETLISRGQGAVYRQAVRTGWGDGWTGRPAP